MGKKNRQASRKRHQVAKEQRRKCKRTERKKRMQSMKADIKVLENTFENNQVSTRFSNMVLHYVLTEADLFPDEPPFDVDAVLSNISRELVIQLVSLFNILYGNADISLLRRWFSSANQNFANQLYNRINQFLLNNHNIHFDRLLFITYQANLEILRRAFALPYNDTTSFSEAEVENSMMRVALSVNPKVIDFTLHESAGIDEAWFINNASNKYLLDLSDSEVEHQMSSQMIMGSRFFKFISSDEKNRGLYEAFLVKYEIKNWQEYFRTLVGLYIGCKEKAARYDSAFSGDIDQTITQSVVNRLCLSYDTYLKYQSDSIEDIEGNSDYRYFRAKPLIRMSDGDIVVINKGFLVDKFYNSLYFDFKELAEQLGDKRFQEIFTSDFIEKTVFDSLIEQCVSEGKYISLSEEKCKENHKPQQNEIGPPDYVLKSKESIIIFECKDIRINGWIIEQRDYKLLIEELKNKLLLKKQSNGLVVRNNRGRPVGVGQLVKHVKNIICRDFHYLEEISSESIYAVLVLSERRTNYDALNRIANRWYNDELENYMSERIRPLIIISLDTITRYKHLFRQDGFERYFEEYIRETEIECHASVDVANRTMTFDTYMQKYPFNLSAEASEIVPEIVGKKRKIQNLT